MGGELSDIVDVADEPIRSDNFDEVIDLLRDRFLVDAKLYLSDLAVDLVERGIYGHGESFLVLQGFAWG
ncbi:hypothetical protein HMPREF2656_02240 [Corynebacterium sp. HMSC034B08]|uniref:hypothetical protein n=1 Tax=Corynebacterium sp. HMSC034B08 TaxID=1715135 RepID=UPI0008A85568|nr:hypothetical protein [Corynebacterium sp. HMSC034B08]OHO28921.1 hypothetical protein HMPREF2656_02240 [Corynebacterium sp. HMSC034B08]